MSERIHRETIIINEDRWWLEIWQEEDPDALLEFVMDLLGYPELDIVIVKNSLEECLTEIETLYSNDKNLKLKQIDRL
jgi:hypothetical protein